jgi:hypothetical protein
MPKGPKGQKRPADVSATPSRVMRIGVVSQFEISEPFRVSGNLGAKLLSQGVPPILQLLKLREIHERRMRREAFRRKELYLGTKCVQLHFASLDAA